VKVRARPEGMVTPVRELVGAYVRPESEYAVVLVVCCDAVTRRNSS
jgi:hypothetical protein